MFLPIPRLYALAPLEGGAASKRIA